MWPSLLRQYREEPDLEEAPDALQDGSKSIEETFKNLRWTRVIALREYEEASKHVYSMVDDILDAHEKMAAIKPEGLPPLISHFDPMKWQATNP